jgi:itaconyl-CoA hydratase
MSGPIAKLTGSDNYFEDFTVGDVLEHARGKTVTEMDGVLITNLVMNTAQGHFNSHRMQGRPIVFGGVTASMCIGLAMQDTGEQVLQELGLNKIRFEKSVYHGNTLYAFSEVLAKDDADREDAGVVTFRHWGVNEDGVKVFQGERTVLMKRRSHWDQQ